MKNMEGYNIERGKAKFILGIDNVLQLETFLRTTDNIIGVAFVGRSNVGKSSTINALFGNTIARVSNTPGRTRQVNVFEFQITPPKSEQEKLKQEDTPAQVYYLFDLPGYGHAKVSKEMQKNWHKLMTCFFEYLSKHICILNIQDARHPDQASDQEFHKYMRNFDNETFLVLNKSDKLKKQKERAALKKIIPAILKEYSWVKKFFITSAIKGDSIPKVNDAIVEFLLNKAEQSEGFEGTKIKG
jgi:GTP-binding protein